MVLLGLLLTACRKDSQAPAAALEVEVTGSRDNPVPGATVTLTSLETTDGDLREATTDARGRVRFDGLLLETYLLEILYLERTTTAFVTIAGDSLHQAFLRIDDLPGADPKILLDAPPSTLASGRALSLSAALRDDRTPMTEIAVRWIVQGPFGKTEVLFDAQPSVFGNVYVDLDSLPVGSSAFLISATDGDGRVARTSFSVRVVE